MKRKNASLVKILVVYPNPLFPDVQETLFREFIDASPRCEMTSNTLLQYREIPDATIDCVFLDVPKQKWVGSPTHWPETNALS